MISNKPQCCGLLPAHPPPQPQHNRSTLQHQNLWHMQLPMCTPARRAPLLRGRT